MYEKNERTETVQAPVETARVTMIETVNKINCRTEEAIGLCEKIGCTLFGKTLEEKNADAVPNCVEDEISQILFKLGTLNGMLVEISERIGA
jgi:hypothetical protein